ncbi:phosphate ABC transporter permease subunit PstC [Holdemania massiliensis]|uniref:phosphate ABC transporter permease subunit PstC n=1 Tax=Holdemania massiliensis TaxID=1468449 RepID=UPI001F0686EA|nr:phosphate ABC transporter permease subunit PstC [Holdemania massiliensis]MCH1940482.1 phosphate ABC transporter permease subunit PstC [Holdemania massiliensis]
MEENLRDWIKPGQAIRKQKTDRAVRTLFFLAALISGSCIVLITFFILMKGIQPFLPNYAYGTVSLKDFLFGTLWRQDQGVYGVGFIVINTLISAFGALLLAFPISVLTALFIVKIAPKPIKPFMKTVVELLASIPSVVYGVFAAGVITTLVKTLAAYSGVSTAGGSSLLAVILLLAIMIFPTITSLSITAIEAVDRDLELGSLALGATATQTHFKVVLTSAKSGIFAGAILGIGRAFGEATAVAMVAGNKLFGPTFNLFDITRTLTSTMLAGLKETTGLDYDIRFSVGLVLMAVILISNLTLNLIKKKVGNMN